MTTKSKLTLSFLISSALRSLKWMCPLVSISVQSEEDVYLWCRVRDSFHWNDLCALFCEFLNNYDYFYDFPNVLHYFVFLKTLFELFVLLYHIAIIKCSTNEIDKYLLIFNWWTIGRDLFNRFWSINQFIGYPLRKKLEEGFVSN